MLLKTLSMSFFIPTKPKAVITVVLIMLWIATAKLFPTPIGGLPLLTFFIPLKIIMEQTAARDVEGTPISYPIPDWIIYASLAIWVIFEFYLLACIVIRLADYLDQPTTTSASSEQ